MGFLKNFFTSSLVHSSGIYTISTIVNSAIPFFMMPILTRYLSPKDYGLVSMFTAIFAILNPFIGLNLHGAVSVQFFKYQKDEMAKYIANCLLLLFVSMWAAFILIYFLGEHISNFTNFPQEWLWTIILVSFSKSLILYVMVIWQVDNKPFKYGIFQNLQTLINISLTILLVVIIGKNWQGRIEAQILTNTLFGVLSFYILIKNGWLDFSFNKSHLIHALKFGIPLIPHTIGGVLINQTDRFFITNMISLADTGIYTVGFMLASTIEIINVSFNTAYAPWLYKQLGRDEIHIKKKIVRLTYSYFFGIGIFSLLVALISPWLLSFLVGKNFIGAYKYISWLALGFAFSGMYYMVANYIFYAGKTHLLSMVTMLTAIVNISFNYIFIKINGTVGAAQATSLAYLMSFLMTWIVSAKVYKMPWISKG